jgi:hypothetical protein
MDRAHRFIVIIAMLVMGCSPVDHEDVPDVRPSRDATADRTSAADGARESAPEDALDLDGASDVARDAMNDDQPNARRCPRLGSWSSSAPWGTEPSHPLPSFALNGRFYVHTQQGGSRATHMATIDASGRVSGFRNAGDHGGGPHGFTALVANNEAWHFRNGHIARYRFDTQGMIAGDVELIEESVDTAFGANRYVWDSAIAVVNQRGAARAIVHLGGFSFSGYTYRPDVFWSPVPVARRFERVGSFPATRPGNAAYVATGDDAGWIFARESNAGRLFRASVERTAVRAFAQAGTLPDGDDNQRGDFFSIGCALFVIRGSRVFAADVATDGSITRWEPQPSLPEAQIDVSWGDGHQEGASWGILGEYVLVTGQRRVHVARIAR